MAEWDLETKRAVAVDMAVGADHDLSVYTSGLTYYVKNSTPSVVAQVDNADITQSDPQGLGYNTFASWTPTSSDLDLAPGKYTHELIGNTGSGLITLASGYLTITDNEVRGAFASGDGTAGDSGTIDLTTATEITVKDGIITGWS